MIYWSTASFNIFYPLESKVGRDDISRIPSYINNIALLLSFYIMFYLNSIKLSQKFRFNYSCRRCIYYLHIFLIAATRTLAQLAFDDDNKKTFVSDEETDVVSTLFDLAKSSPFQVVRESAKGVLWTLSEHLHSSKKYADLGTITLNC